MSDALLPPYSVGLPKCLCKCCLSHPLRDIPRRKVAPVLLRHPQKYRKVWLLFLSNEPGPYLPQAVSNWLEASLLLLPVMPRVPQRWLSFALYEFAWIEFQSNCVCIDSHAAGVFFMFYPISVIIIVSPSPSHQSVL
jgi:hypothetical protein